MSYDLLYLAQLVAIPQYCLPQLQPLQQQAQGLDLTQICPYKHLEKGSKEGVALHGSAADCFVAPQALNLCGIWGEENGDPA